MIKRFCLYGFLKNSDFSKPFIILFYLSLGLHFFEIGILNAFLNILINLMEIPSGAFADLYGKKTAMLVSLSSYVISFILFAAAYSFIGLFPALVFYAIGDAFRTGTHKAIIFDWLQQEGRLCDKTKVYGYTRSWSKYGSAVSVIIAAVIVLYLQNYRFVFILSVIPASLGLWNMSLYPASLNRKGTAAGFSVKAVVLHTGTVLKKACTHTNIRRLIIQDMSFSGCFSVAEQYLQPLLQMQAAVLASFFLVSEGHSTPILTGSVYVILNILSAKAARNTQRFTEKIAGLRITGRFCVSHEEKTSSFLLLLGAFLFLLSGFGFYTQLYVCSISAYSVFFIIINIWVPVNIAQYDTYSTGYDQASILSIASQAKTAAVAVLAPICGFLADRIGIYSICILFSVIVFITALYSIYVCSTRNTGQGCNTGCSP